MKNKIILKLTDMLEYNNKNIDETKTRMYNSTTIVKKKRREKKRKKERRKKWGKALALEGRT